MQHGRLGALTFLATLAGAIGCGGSRPASGQLLVLVQAQTSGAAITRLSLEVSPAGLSQDLAYDPGSAAFAGTLTVPVGPQTLTAKAWAGATLVGTGTASVEVLKDKVLRASITVLDATGPAGGPEHSPVITSFVVPATATVGDVAAAAVTAMDLDGDALAYAWSASPAGCATFADAGAASTQLTAAAAGTCAVTASATAKGGSDRRTANVEIAGATGSVQVSGTFVPQPRITQVELLDGADVIWSIDRTGSDATFHTGLLRGKAYGVRAHFDAVPEGTLQLLSSCGGTFAQPSLSFPATVAAGTFTTPSGGAPACVVTARLTRQTLVDDFPVVLVVP